MTDNDMPEHRLVELIFTFHDATAYNHGANEISDCEAQPAYFEENNKSSTY
jgi:hypothetical protein